MHPRAPWRDVAFCGAYWNCADRLEKLLTHVRPWFRTISIAVQESPDDTLAVARRLADVVVEDKWQGRGDPSFGKAVRASGRPWAFVISDDEWPSEALLDSFQDLVSKLIREQKDGAWVHFVSTINGHDFTRETDEHLRLFRSKIPWPTSQHARPMTDNTIRWRPSKEAFVRHDRSLDEMMTDYVRRYEIGQREAATDQQMAHNQRMMRSAVDAVARLEGWDAIRAAEWWESVVKYAYGGTAPADSAVAVDPEPAEPVEPPEAAPAPPVRATRSTKAPKSASTTRSRRTRRTKAS